MARAELSDVEQLLEKRKIEDYFTRINELWKVAGLRAISKEYGAIPGRLYGLGQIEWGIVVWHSCSGPKPWLNPAS